ncbi:MAG: CDP-diacylglycerol--serine O-phosphatidyltransferase [Pseudomonadales bacterium]
MSAQPPNHSDDDVSPAPDNRRRRRGIYLLPNLITTGALFAGFYAIVAAMNGHFSGAGLAIFAAMALDTADGRVARWTRTESEFGAEYDSLSDMVAFGVAPALVAFSWGLVNLGNLGWVITFVYMACAALRLARYNTSGELDSFTGLASPSAAAIIAALVLVLTEAGYTAGEQGPTYLLGIVTLCTGLLMVSPFEYYSPKSLDLKGRVSFITLVTLVLLFALVFTDPPRVLLFLFSAYALSGPVLTLWRQRAAAKQSGSAAQQTPTDSGTND